MKAKSLRNTATCQKLWREVPSILLLYHTLRAEATFSRYELACEKQLIPRKCSLCSQGTYTMVGGMILRVRPRVKWFFKNLARQLLVLYEIIHFFVKAFFIIDTKGLVLCQERQYFSFFLVVLFQERCFPSVNFTSNSIFFFQNWVASLCMSINRFLKSEILPQRSLLLGFSRLLVCQFHFNNWQVIRG